ncbi:MAG: DUF6210 family protein [Chloroflexota bacterium]
MNKKPVILLYDMVGIGVIVTYPSQVYYANQVCGIACLHKAHPGVLVPLVDPIHDQEKMLYDYFTGTAYMQGRTLPRPYFDDGDADFVDDVLQKSMYTNFLKVDRTQLNNSFEAWVHVELKTQPSAPVVAGDDVLYEQKLHLSANSTVHTIYGFGATTGILTWRNSD